MRSSALLSIGVVPAIVVGAFIAAVLAQAPANQAFEVASVKQNTSGTGGFLGFPSGQFQATNIPLRVLIGVAYGEPQPLPLFRIIGGPSWIDSERFDIVAKPESGVQLGGPQALQRSLMVRNLLIDRFKLKAHAETRELPIYALVLARADGKLGPQIHKSDVDCAAVNAARQGRGAQPPAPPPTTPGSLPPPCILYADLGRIAGNATTLDLLTGALSRITNRLVMNKTGLTGNYNVEVTYTPDQLPTGQPPPSGPPLPQIDPNGPSIYTALQEQLGLKLDSQKGPVNVVVIDSVEHPTPD